MNSKGHVKVSRTPEQGEIVLVHDDTKRQNWKLVKIIQIHKGIYGEVRSATIKTSTGTTTRPRVKLYSLEIRSTIIEPSAASSITNSGIDNKELDLLGQQLKKKIVGMLFQD